jgi:beta-glucosidase/6-phospho-beta-glucosidase/beta-galactosidase
MNPAGWQAVPMNPAPAPLSDLPERSGRVLPPGFLFGVATAGFQVEGGFNGPGGPANNWATWERTGRVEPSGNAVGFWEHPEEALDRAAGLGCNSFRFGLEWARVEPREGQIDTGALERYGRIVDGCLERGMEPLVTLLHFTHPSWLGEEFWLRADSPDRFLGWVELAVGALAGRVRHWVTLNEINVLAFGSWLLGVFPPGRRLAFGDHAVATDNLLAAHVVGYDAIHRARPDAVVTTNNGCASAYDLDRLLTDLLMARSLGVEREDLDRWIGDRRAGHAAALPPPAGRGGIERLVREGLSALSPYGRRRGGARDRSPRRAVDAVYASAYERTLDAVGLDYYDPMVGRHLRAPGHRTAGGRSWPPARALWDDVPEPGGLSRWLRTQQALSPGVPLWVVENGLCNRVRNGRSYPRLDGWDRPRYLREHLAATVAAVDSGVPVAGYWHWSLVDNYEWGSYEPRFGLFGVDRHRGESGYRWMETDALGADAAGTYRRIIAGLRDGDRSVLDAAP